MKQRVNKFIEDELDKQFPKGNKARGRALVLVAVAQMEIDKLDNEINKLSRYETKRVKKERRQFSDEVFNKITDFFYSCNKIMFEKAKGYVDIYLTGDDYGQQNGPLISYSLWSELIKPHLKRLYSLAKEYGLYITHHSCGSITYILDDLIEIGVNTIDPVQVRAYDMNFESLVKRYAGRIVLQGSIDTQKTLPFGTKEDVKKEVISRINFFKNRGGFILAPTQNLLSEIPMINILSMYKTAFEYGKLNE